MFSRETKIINVTKMLFEELSVAARYNPHIVLWVRSKLCQRLERRGSWQRHRRRLDNRRQGTLPHANQHNSRKASQVVAYIIIQQEQSLLRLLVLGHQTVLWNVGRLPRLIVVTQERQQLLDENGSPCVRCVRRHNLVELGMPNLFLRLGHQQPAVYRIGNFLYAQSKRHILFLRNRRTPRFHGLTSNASSMFLLMPINSLKTLGLLFVLFCAMTNSMLVVFIPSRRGVMTARSATLSSA